MKLGLENFEMYMFYLMLVSYLLSMFSYWIWAAFKVTMIGKLATGFAIIGFGANTATIIARTLIVQRPPLTNGYEFLVTFTWGILAVYLFAEFRFRLKALGVFILPIAFLILAYITMKMGPDERVAQAIPPALKSQWLTFHVITAILAYGAFAISFGLGAMYLIKSHVQQGTGQKTTTGLIQLFPQLEYLDELAYRVVGFAFPLLSLCIITGAIWANYAWGTYWSWDPKETWSLVTWLIYAGYLHARLMYGWKGNRAAWMAVFGFMAVLFTFFGVNYFLPGLHSYA